MKKRIIDQLNRMYSNGSCLFIGSKLIRVMCPFTVVVLSDVDTMKKGDTVVVTAVKMCYSLRLIYKVGQRYYYHSHFELLTQIE
jgi:hypothetical protein